MAIGSQARRAAAFATALDGSTDGADGPTARLTGLATRLGALPLAVPPRSDAARTVALAAFTAAAAEAARHAAAPAAHATATAAHGTSHAAAQAAGHGVLAGAHGMLMPLVTGVAAVAVAGGAVGVAAHRSLPGDPFYGLKRGTESVQQHLAGGGAAGARQRLASARTRLAELRAVFAEPPSATRTARIGALVAALDGDVARAAGPLLAGGPASVADLRTVVSFLRSGLSALPVDPAVTRSVALLGSLWSVTATLPGLVTPGSGGPAATPTARPGTGAGSTAVGRPPVTATVPPPAAVSTVAAPPVPLPSTVPSALPSTLPPLLPSALPSTLPPLVPSAVPSALSSVLGGLLGGG